MGKRRRWDDDDPELAELDFDGFEEIEVIEDYEEEPTGFDSDFDAAAELVPRRFRGRPGRTWGDGNTDDWN